MNSVTAHETMTEPMTHTVVHLPAGLLGFEQTKKYALVANPGEEPFHWLQSLDGTNLAFLVVSPFVIVPDYQPELTDEDASAIGLDQPEDALIYNIVTLRGKGRATVNLKGPIVLNRHTLLGRQTVLLNAARWSVQHPAPVED